MTGNDKEAKYFIEGKTLVITDLHIGLNKANQSRLSIIIKVFKNFLTTIKEENVKNIICCGDIFHSRTSLDLQALNVGIKLLAALAEKCNCYLILGNHDLYYKNTANVNSSNVFRHIDNVHIIDETTTAIVNGEKALFVPWLGTLEGIEKNSYDLGFGHFDINGKYLIASYIEEHSRKKNTSEDIQEILENDALLNEASNVKDIQLEFNSIKKNKQKAADLVGDFVELIKEGGTIYAGHIHGHKEFVSKMRKFIFVGSPYQQNFGEMESTCGYYLLDENNVPKFILTKNIPIHIRIRVSDILREGIENFNYSIVKGNIVQKIYDADIDLNTDALINQRISDNLPFEETLPEYTVALSADNNVITNESLEAIKKSKLEYIKSYVDNIEQSVLDSSNLNRDDLFNVLESYFNRAMENS